ncbi:MAG: COX15/CtaA family protein [Pseudomonadota bacterium]
MRRVIFWLCLSATIWTLMVVVLGAYVRLSHAGLGCPDWPGCYGFAGAPKVSADIAAANEAFPERPVEYGKALKEMLHRYVAGLLWLFILVIAVLTWRNRVDPRQPLRLPWALFALVTFQAALGMFTVTEKLNPTVVMAHLLGGMATLSLLWLMTLRHRDWTSRSNTLIQHNFWAALGLLVLIAQISLGGWTSANYAALACPDLPQCQGQWWPKTDFSEAFVMWRGTGIDYEGGVLGIDARTAIHLAHRIGAIVTLLVLGGIALWIARSGFDLWIRRAAKTILVLLVAQITLGIVTVAWGLRCLSPRPTMGLQRCCYCL